MTLLKETYYMEYFQYVQRGVLSLQTNRICSVFSQGQVVTSIFGSVVNDYPVEMSHC